MIFAFLGRRKVIVEKKLLKLYFNNVPVYKKISKKILFCVGIPSRRFETFIVNDTTFKKFQLN